MKTSHYPLRQKLALTLPLFLAAVLTACAGADSPAGSAAADSSKDKSGSDGSHLIPLELKLPSQAFKGTPKDIPISSYTEPYDPDKKRPPMMVPAGLVNVAPGKTITCSDKNVSAEKLAKLTDGDKEPSEDSIIVLRKGTQYMQMDLGSPHELFAIVIWHAHNAPKVYHDVIVQLADDADFTQNVRPIFNNDQDNSSNTGVGTDREYFEDYQGKLIDAKGAKARFIRFYSKGSTESALNEYSELEVYGRPAQ